MSSVVLPSSDDMAAKFASLAKNEDQILLAPGNYETKSQFIPGDAVSDTSGFVEQEEHTDLLRQFRRAVDTAGIPSKDLTDSTIMRFLRARQLKLDLALKMYISHVKWRSAFTPDGAVASSEIERELSAEKIYLAVKEGKRSVAFLIGSKHDAGLRDMEEFKRFAVYALDITIASLPPGEEKFSAILDVGNLSYKNLDPKAMISVFDFLQAHYPERLGRLFIVHVPYIFWGAWKIVSPFIDRVTRSKIVFVEEKKMVNTLLAEIPGDMLPKEYGGTGKLIRLQDVVVPNWPPPVSK